LELASLTLFDDTEVDFILELLCTLLQFFSFVLYLSVLFVRFYSKYLLLDRNDGAVFDLLDEYGLIQIT